jgi:hypothetical protein
MSPIRAADPYAPVSLSAVTFALVLSFYNKTPSGAIRWGFAAPQIALTFVAAAVPVATAILAKLREKRAEDRERVAREEALLRTNKTPLIQSSARWPPRLPPGSWRVFVSTLLYSVTWIVVPTFPVGNGACWSVGSAVLWGAAVHAVTVSIAAITPLNGFGMATCATIARARATGGAAAHLATVLMCQRCQRPIRFVRIE